MNTSYITSEAITKLYEKYPAAYTFLCRENLKEERRQLTRELTWQRDPRRVTWIQERLVTLLDWQLARLVIHLNKGTSDRLPDDDRAELKKHLESGRICWGTSGSWVVIKRRTNA